MSSTKIYRQHVIHFRNPLRFPVNLARRFGKLPRSGSVVPAKVAMSYFNFVTFFFQEFTKMLGYRHRPMASAGAADCDCQVALAFADVLRQQKEEEIREAAEEFRGLCL